MKILIVKLSSLGDVIQTMPVVDDLRTHLGLVSVDWVVEEAFAGLVERVSGLDRVIPIAQRRWRKSWWTASTRRERKAFLYTLQSAAYDAVIDFQGLVKSALVARQAKLAAGGFRATYANASEACGYEWPVRYLLDRPVPMARRIHAVARYRLLAARAIGYDAPALADAPPRYGLRTAPVGERKAVVLAHGTTRIDNEWPAPAWAELARRLAGQGQQVWLPQANEREEKWVHALARAIGPSATVLPRMGLPQMMDVMAGSAGVIGVDSGLSHLAVALDLAHVQLFSQPRAWRAGPVGRPHQVAVGGERAPTVDEVWRAWRAVLAASKSA